MLVWRFTLCQPTGRRSMMVLFIGERGACELNTRQILLPGSFSESLTKDGTGWIQPNSPVLSSFASRLWRNYVKICVCHDIPVVNLSHLCLPLHQTLADLHGQRSELNCLYAKRPFYIAGHHTKMSGNGLAQVVSTPFSPTYGTLLIEFAGVMVHLYCSHGAFCLSPHVHKMEKTRQPRSRRLPHPSRTGLPDR
jgi:hypothetical protein